MMKWTEGNRPDITPAQIVSAVPILCSLLAAFGVWTPTPDQKDALEATVGWAAALVLGDAGLRVGRGLASAKKEAATSTIQAAAATAKSLEETTERLATPEER
jgi:hypothetical protein